MSEAKNALRELISNLEAVLEQGERILGRAKERLERLDAAPPLSQEESE